ncbi:hypothetical protein JCM8547_001516 [Rhodosporidiobolus lusitaniae]
MLDRLPPELIDHILLLAIPSLIPWPLDQDADAERRRILRTFCLVSHILRDQALDGCSLAEQVRVLDVRRLDGMHELEGLLRRVEGVQEVVFSGWRNARLSGLAALPDLSTLSFLGVQFSWKPTFRLSSLVQLNLKNGRFPPDYSSTLFATSALPSLRVLAVGICTSSTEQFIPSLSPSFLSQLDMVQMHATPSALNTVTLPPVYCDSPTPVLFTNPWEPSPTGHELLHLQTLRPRHLRILSMSLWSFVANTHAANTLLTDLSTFLHLPPSSSSSPLLSLHLPSFLQSINTTTTPVTYGLLQKVLKRCEEGKVEVVWYEEGYEERWMISKGFWRWAKGWKERRREREEIVVGSLRLEW